LADQFENSTPRAAFLGLDGQASQRHLAGRS
jgi:hypothetical protein